MRLIHLKPCPFCGGEAEMVRDGTKRQSCQVKCVDCHATQEGIDETCWNNRPSPPRSELAGVLRELGRLQAVHDESKRVNEYQTGLGMIVSRRDDVMIWSCCQSPIEVKTHRCPR